MSANIAILSLNAVALLFYVSTFLDKLIERIPGNASGYDQLVFTRGGKSVLVVNAIGMAMIVAIACLRFGWEISVAVDSLATINLSIDIALIASLALITFRNQHYLAGLATALLPTVSAISYARYLDYRAEEMLDIASIAAPCISLLGLLWFRWNGQNLATIRHQAGFDLQQFKFVKNADPSSALAGRIVSWLRCHAIVMTDIGTWATVALGLLVYVPYTLMSNVLWYEVIGIKQSSLVIAVWLVACTLFLRSRWASVALAAIAPPYASAMMVSFSPGLLSAYWAPVFWVSVAALICTLSHFLAKREFAVACMISRIWLCAISMIGLVYLSVPIRIAVVIAIATLLVVRDNINIRGERLFIAILCNIHALLFVATIAGAEGWVFQSYDYPKLLTIAASMLPALAISMMFADTLLCRISRKGAEWWGINLRLVSVLLFVVVCMGPIASNLEQMLVVGAIAASVVCEFLTAIRSRSELRVWTMLATAGLAGFWAFDQDWLEIGNGWCRLILLVASACSIWLSEIVCNRHSLSCFSRPLAMAGLIAPAGITVFTVVQELAGPITSVALSDPSHLHSLNYLLLLSVAAIYFYYGLTSRKSGYLILSSAILNMGLALVWFKNGFSDPQFYCVPIGLSILWIVELLKKELPNMSHDPLRYVGALVILVSPVYGILGSGWLHLFSLMVLSVLVILLAIGLRIRVLMYTGAAFLLADLAGMLIRSTLDNPTLLWVGGVGLGGAVIALAALCENHRENVLAKIRMLSAELGTWN